MRMEGVAECVEPASLPNGFLGSPNGLSAERGVVGTEALAPAAPTRSQGLAGRRRLEGLRRSGGVRHLHGV